MSASPSAPRASPLPRPLRGLVQDARARWWATATPEPGSASALLAEAICGDRLRVAYQPIVELAEQRLVAMEALVRLPDPPHPDLGSPAELVAVAEAVGLVSALGTEVLVHACAQLAAWRSAPDLRELQVHVNVSPLQLRDAGFVETVERTLEVTELPTSALVLEVTESAAFEEDGVAEATLSTLSSLGVEISIDDFGTGFASLELLASTPARSIKLDRGFVASVGEVSAPPRGRALVVQAALGLGRALGLRVVAEGIETAAQAHTLASWGCVYGQGYLYARPALVPALDLGVVRPGDEPRPAVWDRSPDLSSDATDLALAVAAVLSAAHPEGGTVRADAQELALQLSEVLGFDRRQVDTAALLATIADAPQRLAEMFSPRSAVPAAAELARALGSRSDLGTAATPGTVAATAQKLAIARRDGVTSLEQALGVAATGVDRQLRERITTWWDRHDGSPSPLRELRAVEHRLRSRDDAARRLRALSALTHAIGGSGTLEDVLEVTAEEARTALGASALSISRFDREHGLLRVLVNVGDLVPWLERRPQESYPLTDFPNSIGRLLDRAAILQVAGSSSMDTKEQRLLAERGKGSSAAVPVVVDGVTWGEVYATTALGEPPFTTADTPFLTAIASVVSLAIRRFEHVNQLTALAGEDPLTRTANRRALEDRLTRALAAEGEADVGLLMLDVEGLSEVNAIHGEAEGDRMLVRVADVVCRVALTQPGAFPARIGGDEFCIALQGDHGDVEDLVARIRERLADGPMPRPTLSAGFASVRAGTTSLSELLRRADAAQYLAKRTGAPLAAVGPDSDIPTPDLAPAERQEPDRRSRHPAPERSTTAALRRWSDTLGDGSVVRQLEGLGEATGALLDLNGWAISEHCPTNGTLHTRIGRERRRKPNQPVYAPVGGEAFELADYPTTAAALRNGVGFSIHIDDAAADRGERELLLEYGQCYLIAITADTDDTQWLLELYGDERSTLLAEARPVVEALASRTFGQEMTCPPSRAQRAPNGDHATSGRPS